MSSEQLWLLLSPLLSLVIYVCGVLATWAQEKLGKKKGKGKSRWRRILIAVIIGGGLATFGLQLWEKKQEADDQRDADRVRKDERDAAAKQIADLKRTFSISKDVNPRVKLAILDEEIAKINEQIVAVQEARIFSTNTFQTLSEMRNDLQARTQREAELAKLEKERADWLSARNAVEEEINSEAAKAEAERAAKQAKQERLKAERSRHRTMIDVFDCVVTGLNKRLQLFSKDTGLSLSSDFKNGAVGMWTSSMVQEDLLVRNKNTLRLGTDDAWNFEIETITNAPRGPANDDRIRLARTDYEFSLVIRTKNTASNALIILRPAVPSMSRFTPPGLDYVDIRSDAAYASGFGGRASITNYTESIDEALARIIAAHDKQFPLPTGANSSPR
jgi:hypothetical protein